MNLQALYETYYWTHSGIQPDFDATTVEMNQDEMVDEIVDKQGVNSLFIQTYFPDWRAVETAYKCIQVNETGDYTSSYRDNGKIFNKGINTTEGSCFFKNRKMCEYYMESHPTRYNKIIAANIHESTGLWKHAKQEFIISTIVATKFEIVSQRETEVLN